MKEINNDYYNHLGENWYTAHDDPIAVLRAETKVKNPWIISKIKEYFNTDDLKVADIACGGGFLANDMAEEFSYVTGLDASESSLSVAAKNDTTKKVRYVHGDAYTLPFKDNSFDVVCTMDFLEHVSDPQKVIAECSRILKPNGLFFYQTFNRNFLSWLVVIKFMEWFVPNTPKNLHVTQLFIKPTELQKMLDSSKLEVVEWHGWGPAFNKYFFESVLKRKVSERFTFRITKRKTIGYIGYAKKVCE